jgi:four helix bundle protein
MVNGKWFPKHPHRKDTLMRPHHKLEAWNKALELVTEVYRTTENFPREERYGLTSQIRRAAVSIPANIAEGAARFSSKEFARFLSNAQGSASELETELIIAHRLRYLDDANFSGLSNQLERIGRLITGLSKHVGGTIVRQARA